MTITMKKVNAYDSFDLFHRNHCNLRKQVKMRENALVVGVTAGQYNKSQGKLDGIDSLSNKMKSARDKGVL